VYWWWESSLNESNFWWEILRQNKQFSSQSFSRSKSCSKWKIWCQLIILFCGSQDQLYTYITQFQLISVIFRHYFTIFFQQAFQVFSTTRELPRETLWNSEKNLLSFTPWLTKCVQNFPSFCHLCLHFAGESKHWKIVEENRE
jgi:hypothetical protein